MRINDTVGNYVQHAMNNKQGSILVVGGGWSGLACAVELASRGHSVTVLESARQLGGRARRVAFGDYTVDNGQHILLGAYHHSLDLIKRLSKSTEDLLYRQVLDLFLHKSNNRYIHFRLPHLLSPLNLLYGIISARGLNLKDRLRAFIFGIHLFSNTLVADNDTSVSNLLVKYHQTANTIKSIWEPICLAALNTPIEQASAQIFIRVLYDSFCRSHSDADIIIPRLDLGSLLPDRAFDFIESHGGFVHLRQRVMELVIDQRHITGVKTEDKKYEADHVALAIPPYACQTLLKPHPALHEIAYNINAYSYNPICTIYLQYPDSVKLERPIQGMLEATTHWIIDRRICDQPGLIAAVISGPGKHMHLDNDQLAKHIQEELQYAFPHWPEATSSLVIREKRATFNCRAGIDLIRPSNHTPVSGLWLAGDYTNTGYPATIESAVMSGQHAAQMIHHEVTKE